MEFIEWSSTQSEPCAKRQIYKKIQMHIWNIYIYQVRLISLVGNTHHFWSNNTKFSFTKTQKKNGWLEVKSVLMTSNDLHMRLRRCVCTALWRSVKSWGRLVEKATERHGVINIQNSPKVCPAQRTRCDTSGCVECTAKTQWKKLGT